MKQKMINVLNWLKSRKTAFLSCLLVVCLGCTVLAVSRSNKTAKAAVNNVTERSYLIQTYLAPTLFYPRGTGAMFTFACSLSFYVRPEGFAWSSGAENQMIKSSNFDSYVDYETQFLYDSNGNPAVILIIQQVRAYVSPFSAPLGSSSFSWTDFYNRLMRNEYSLEVTYYNRVINPTTVNSSASFCEGNSASFQFYFTHNENKKYDFTFVFWFSSMNAVKNTHSVRLTNNLNATDDYQILRYYTVNTSVINVATDNQYEQGYQDGKNAGFTEGENKGYLDGKNAGLAEGEKIGYDKGFNEKLQNITPWQIIVDGVNTFLNVQVLPGVNVSVILSVGFGLVLLGLAIKIFLGG